MVFEIVFFSLIEVVITLRFEFLFRALLVKESRTGMGFSSIYMVW